MGSRYLSYSLLVLVCLILLQKTRCGLAALLEPEPCTINGDPDYCPLTEICCTTYCCPKNHVCFNESCLSYWVIIGPSVVGLGFIFVITLCCINKLKSKRWSHN